MFWTAFVWGIGATAGGSVGLMLFVVLFAAWSYLMRTPAAVRSMELAELTYAVAVERKELSERQLTAVTGLAASMGVLAQLANDLTAIEQDEYNGNSGDEALCDHPHFSDSSGLGGFEG